MRYVIVGEKDRSRKAQSAEDAIAALELARRLTEDDYAIIAIIDMALEGITTEELAMRADQQELRAKIH